MRHAQIPLLVLSAAVGGCGAGTLHNGNAPPPPPKDPDVWMALLLRDGYKQVAAGPFLQETRLGPRKYRYLLRKGDDAWACYEVESVMEPEAPTDRRCLPYRPVPG